LLSHASWLASLCSQNGACFTRFIMLPSFEEIVSNFEFLDDWDDRYRYLIELGRMLEPLSEEAHIDANKVQGCASQVWLETRIEDNSIMYFKGDSDAHIVKGLVALMIVIHSGKIPQDIMNIDTFSLFQSLGLADHLTPQRSNGVKAMVGRIKRDAELAHHKSV
jgi:cysteine desulfuration protein SufE